jgi:mannose-6-phosphate isomerase-like protein (cupin superfamily)
MEQINSGKQGVFVVKNFFNQDYSWDNFINSISDAYDSSSPNNKVDINKETIGKVNFFQKLTVTLDNINEQNFPGLQDKINKLTELHERVKPSTRCVGYFGAVSFTTKEPTTGKHNDPIDVIYSQFVGSVTWTIYDEEGSESFDLGPGDVIYVPKDVMHEVTSLTPRAALSFMFEV